MNLHTSYLLKKYLKSFFIIFIALELFTLSMDLIINLPKINSANMQFLYIGYKSILMIKYNLPLALIFAMLSTMFSLIKNNELVSMYALGISRTKIILPIFISSLVITALYVRTNTTSAAHAYDYSRNILHNKSLVNPAENLFLRYNDSYVFFQKLKPLQKIATNVRVFEVKNKKLIKSVKAKEAFFDDKKWILKDAEVKILPDNYALGGEGIKISQQKEYITLHGFKPEIIDNAYKAKSSFSISEAIEGITLFRQQGLGTSKIESKLYFMSVFPFFAPFLMVIFFFFIPAHSRYAHISIQNSLFIFFSILTWGVLFMLNKVAFNGLVNPALATILPVALLMLVSLYMLVKNSTSNSK